MAIQLSESARNAMLDAIETAIGTSPILKIRTGAVPASCATANPGLRHLSAVPTKRAA